MEQIKARLSIIDDLLQQVKRGLRAGVSQPPPPPVCKNAQTALLAFWNAVQPVCCLVRVTRKQDS